jgi:hypothetical protein
LFAFKFFSPKIPADALDIGMGMGMGMGMGTGICICIGIPPLSRARLRRQF